MIPSVIALPTSPHGVLCWRASAGPRAARAPPRPQRALSSNIGMLRDPASRRLRRLDAPPAGDVAFVVRIHAERVGSRTDDLVVDRADGRFGLRIHGREGVDNSHPGAVAVVQRVADAGLRQAERPWSHGGFRAHAADSSTSVAEDPGRNDGNRAAGAGARRVDMRVYAPHGIERYEGRAPASCWAPPSVSNIKAASDSGQTPTRFAPTRFFTRSGERF